MVAIFPTALLYLPRGCNISNMQKIRVLEFLSNIKSTKSEKVIILSFFVYFMFYENSNTGIFLILEILQPRGKYCNAVGNIATTFLLLSVAIFPTPL